MLEELKKTRFFLPPACLLLCYCCQFSGKDLGRTTTVKSAASQETLEVNLKWRCHDTAFKNPESVIFDENHEYIYVTNGKKYGQGTDGFISKLSKDGILIESKWVSDLNRPTGMAIRKDRLYVADVNRLLILRLPDGEILHSIGEPLEGCGLNDVLVAHDNVFVSASAIHAILRVEAHELLIWAQDSIQLAWANGLEIIDSHLVVGGTMLHQIHFTQQSLQKIELEPIDFDGIAAISDSQLLLTTVEEGALWYASRFGRAIKLLQDGSYWGDIDFVPEQRLLLVARGDHSEEKYWVEAHEVVSP